MTAIAPRQTLVTQGTLCQTIWQVYGRQLAPLGGTAIAGWQELDSAPEQTWSVNIKGRDQPLLITRTQLEQANEIPTRSPKAQTEVESDIGRF